MNKIIEDELGLPRLSDALEELEKQEEEISDDDPPEEKVENYSNMMETFNKIEKQLSDIDGLHDIAKHDQEMDEISEKALKTFDNMIDLGHQVDPKHAGQIFEPAANILKMSLESRKSKVDVKLRFMKLQLDRARLEAHRKDDEPLDIEGEEVFAGNRSQVLDIILENEKNDKKD